MPKDQTDQLPLFDDAPAAVHETAVVADPAPFVEPTLPVDPEVEAQLAGLRKMDPLAMKRYNFSDLREREVMEEVLRRPWPRTKGR